MAYQVNEIFTSIQGEGHLVGTAATFIRLQGCPVKCDWCDSESTWGKGGTMMTVEDIMKKVIRRHVVITGGEPIIHNLDELLVSLHASSHYTQLETSGANWFKGDHRPHWITWSPKEKLNYTAPAILMGSANEIKWVVDENLHYHTVMESFDPKGWNPYNYLMPEGCPPRAKMVEKVLYWLSIMTLQQQTMFRYGDRIQYRIGVR